MEPLYYEREFQKIAQNFAVRSHRYALDAGRQTIEFSAAVNGKRWRRITDGNPCAFCAMLSTRSDYRTRESALRVVGRQTGYGTAAYRSTGQVRATGATRGSQEMGDKYHNFCGCTVVEVLSEWVFTPAEEAQHELYNRAAKQCDRDGVPRTAQNVLAKMRELDDGSVIHDAVKPETQTTGGGGGSKPPRRMQLGAAGDPGRFEFHFDGRLGSLDDWVPPPEALASHIAPAGDPYRYYLPAEASTAEWLRESLNITTQSIQERRGRGIKSADSWVAADRRTLEIKNPETASYLALRDHIVRGSRQSTWVVVKADVPYPREVTEGALAEALTQAGSHLAAVIIELEGGSYLVWQR